MGIQLRRKCSTEESFDRKMEERINQFVCSGWNIDSTKNEFLKAKKFDRKRLIFEEKSQKEKMSQHGPQNGTPGSPLRVL